MRRCLRSYLEDQQKFVAHVMVSCLPDIQSSLGMTRVGSVVPSRTAQQPYWHILLADRLHLGLSAG